MPSKEDHERWDEDAALLAEVGQALYLQETRVTVRLPRRLADRAIAAWDRDDSGPVTSETPRRARSRSRAGTLALIGLSIREHGRAEGDDVVVALDAWDIGAACDAADEAGLLAPSRRPPAG